MVLAFFAASDGIVMENLVSDLLEGKRDSTAKAPLTTSRLTRRATGVASGNLAASGHQ